MIQHGHETLPVFSNTPHDNQTCLASGSTGTVAVAQGTVVGLGGPMGTHRADDSDLETGVGVENEMKRTAVRLDT